jgi:hypothetical protein
MHKIIEFVANTGNLSRLEITVLSFGLLARFPVIHVKGSAKVVRNVDFEGYLCLLLCRQARRRYVLQDLMSMDLQCFCRMQMAIMRQ